MFNWFSFSISDEVYGEIQLLEPMMENVKGFTNHGVSILGGMLCFYYTHAPSNSRETTLKLWVMKDYSVKGVLDTIIYTIQDNVLHLLRPIYMFADGEVLLNYRCIDQVGFNFPFRTSKGPLKLWHKYNILKQGIIYTISPKSLISACLCMIDIF